MRLVSPGMRRLAIVLWIVAVLLVVLAPLTRGIAALPAAIVPSVFTAFFAWAVLWRPRIEVDAEALSVTDVRRRTTFAWPRVQEIRTKYGVEVVSTEGVRRTWIAPTGRTTLLDLGTGERLTLPEAAERMRAFAPVPVVVDGPPPASVVPAPITHRVHGWTIAALVVLGIAASVAGAHV
jgi:hypothetical protein